jgi:micrococcal nuclease
MYEYKLLKIHRVYDGDTIIVDLDVGFGIYTKQKLILANINAPELRGESLEKARISRDFLRISLESALSDKKLILIKTKKDRKGKYGRYLAEIFINGISLNEEMINKGFAIRY